MNRREALYRIGLVMGGVTLVACGRKEDEIPRMGETPNVIPTPELVPTMASTATQVPVETETIVPPETLTATLRPTETGTPLSEEEVERNVEALREKMDGLSFVSRNTLVEVIRYGWNGRAWFEAKEFSIETVPLSNIRFDITNIEADFVPETVSSEAYYVFKGYIPNMTGDPSRWLAHVARFYPNSNELEWLATPLGKDLEKYQGLEEHYGSGLERTVYDSKVYNMLLGLDVFRKSALTGFGQGETFSFLEAVKLAEVVQNGDYSQEEGHLSENPDFGLPGFDSSRHVVRLGGYCGFATVTGKVAYRAYRKGGWVLVNGQPHSGDNQYYVNREDKDTLDYTAVIANGKRVDVKIKNVSNERLYLIPQAHLEIPDLPEGTVLGNSMEKPASVRLWISITLTDRQPALEDSQSVLDCLKRFMAYREKYGGGEINGFDVRPYWGE